TARSPAADLPHRAATADCSSVPMFRCSSVFPSSPPPWRGSHIGTGGTQTLCRLACTVARRGSLVPLTPNPSRTEPTREEQSNTQYAVRNAHYAPRPSRRARARRLRDPGQGFDQRIGNLRHPGSASTRRFVRAVPGSRPVDGARQVIEGVAQLVHPLRVKELRSQVPEDLHGI